MMTVTQIDHKWYVIKNGSEVRCWAHFLEGKTWKDKWDNAMTLAEAKAMVKYFKANPFVPTTFNVKNSQGFSEGA